MKRMIILTAFAVMVILVSGCTGPTATPTPLPTATPVPTPVPTATAIPTPTLIGGSDEAHISFTYNLKSTTQEYDGIKVDPGMRMYILEVGVSSDKPVQTSGEWFRMEFKTNESDKLRTYEPMTYRYVARTIGPTSGKATGTLYFFMPDTATADNQPRPYYEAPAKTEQKGPYKVYGRTYGIKGLVL